MRHHPRSLAGSSSSALLPVLRAWLALGLLALVLLPPARGFSQAIGWLPFWLVAAPLLMLALAEHRQMAVLVGALARRRRRLHARRPQARLLRGRAAQRGVRAA